MNNPFFTNLRKPASQDFMQNPSVQMRSDFNAGNIQQQPRGNFFQNNQWASQDSSGVGGIGATITSAIPSTQDGDFSVDKNAGFKGSFQGLSSGGAVSAVIGGVMGQIGEMSRVNKNLDNLQTSIDGVQYDANGRAVLNSQGIAAGNAAIQDLRKGEESMKLGKGLDPATAAFAGVMGTRRKLRRKRAQLQRGIASAQNEYNTADISSRAQANAMEDYQQRMNPYARLNNVYRAKY